jgi:hypothetical protein
VLEVPADRALPDPGTVPRTDATTRLAVPSQWTVEAILPAKIRSWTANLPVARKLLLLVVIGCSVAALVGTVAIVRLGQVDRRTTDIYRRNLLPSAELP